MATVTLFNQSGAEVGQMSLPASLFEVKPNPAVVHEAVVIQQANSRQVIAHTKGRGEVRGGGKKPWKQKGTGRARHGSSRSPIWVGGGITFGPTNQRNFSRKLNKTAKRKALAMCLSDKLSGGQLLAVDSLVLGEAKTKQIARVLKQLPKTGKRTLLLLEPSNSACARAARNMPRVTPLSAASMNVVDLLGHDIVVASKAALEHVIATYSRA